jgi:hypothetical protein
VSDICVAHLVRKKNGIEPFSNFLDSYLSHPAGVEHELLILFKGFSGRSDIAPYENLLKNTPHTFLILSDYGFDLRPYFVAAERSNCRHLCFLNSFSLIQDDNWLLKLYRQIMKPGIGLVGATGSWGAISPGRFTTKNELPLWKKLLRPLIWRAARGYFRLYFEPFPNFHIRTNGFMVARDTMLKIHSGLLLTKMQAYRLESGRNSITRQIEKMGLEAIVVGKDGVGYGKNEWNVSNTFWCQTQSNLLISDNQTRKYDAEDRECRSSWERFAWGQANEKKHGNESRGA